MNKSATIQEAVNTQKSKYIHVLRPDDLKLRPIEAGTQSATQR